MNLSPFKAWAAVDFVWWKRLDVKVPWLVKQHGVWALQRPSWYANNFFQIKRNQLSWRWWMTYFPKWFYWPANTTSDLQELLLLGCYEWQLCHQRCREQSQRKLYYHHYCFQWTSLKKDWTWRSFRRSKNELCGWKLNNFM